VRDASMDSTILISIMHANNEVGTVEPIQEIGQIAREHGIAFHTDAAQSVGKMPTRVADLGVDLLTVAGHKLYAPKGVGALYVRNGVKLEPLVHGAGHERGLRAGTENVAGIVGLGQACKMVGRGLGENAERIRGLRDLLHQELRGRIPGLTLNGHPTARLPNTLNVSFPGVDSDQLLSALPEIAASTGAACHAHNREPSAVLNAMGIPVEVALGAVRFSLGTANTADEIRTAVEQVASVANSLQGRRVRGAMSGH